VEEEAIVRRVGIVAHVAVLAQLAAFDWVLAPEIIENVDSSLGGGAVVAAIAESADGGGEVEGWSRLGASDQRGSAYAFWGIWHCSQDEEPCVPRSWELPTTSPCWPEVVNTKARAPTVATTRAKRAFLTPAPLAGTRQAPLSGGACP
jgi:hypothetical protein